MKTKLILFAALTAVAGATIDKSPETSIDTQWIGSKPEVLTYRSTSAQGNGMFQTSISKTGTTIETKINVVAPGYMKWVTGVLSPEMKPLRSAGRIFVHDQIEMEMEARYDNDSLHVATTMKPYGRVMKADLDFKGLVVDPSQVPFMVRVLPLAKDARFEFPSLNPQTNTLTPYTAQVVGEETMANLECFKVACRSFEGAATYWVEKAGRRRVVRIEQSEPHRVTELVQ